MQLFRRLAAMPALSGGSTTFMRGFRTGHGRGAGKAWSSAGRGPIMAKGDNDGFPKPRIMVQRTNRRKKFVPKYAKMIPSQAGIFKDRFSNTRLAQMERHMENQKKPWSLTEEEYKAIKNNIYKPHFRERRPKPDVIMRGLKEEEVARTKINFPREIADFKAGDRLKITKLLQLGDHKKLEVLKGMCIARSNKLNDSNFSILNHKLDTTYEMKIPLWSPFLLKVEVLKKGTIRRKKAFYLRNRPVGEFQT